MTTLLFAVTAQAEKLPDTQEVESAGAALTINGTLDAASPIWDRIFGGGGPNLACDGLPSDSGSNGQFYAAHCISVTDSTPIEAVLNEATTTIGDTVMALYCDPFNAATPGVNFAYYDDDSGAGFLSAFVAADGVTLTPSNQYWLVLSTFSSGEGEASRSIQAPTSSSVGRLRSSRAPGA